MIYLDTHVFVWIFESPDKFLSSPVKQVLREGKNFLVSPMVLLEAQYLFEKGRIRRNPDKILEYLTSEILLRICPSEFKSVVASSKKEIWTRDPFDRIIVAQCRMNQGQLLTKDKLIHKNFDGAVW